MYYRAERQNRYAGQFFCEYPADQPVRSNNQPMRIDGGKPVAGDMTPSDLRRLGYIVECTTPTVYCHLVKQYGADYLISPHNPVSLREPQQSIPPRGIPRQGLPGRGNSPRNNSQLIGLNGGSLKQ